MHKKREKEKEREEGAQGGDDGAAIRFDGSRIQPWKGFSRSILHAPRVSCLPNRINEEAFFSCSFVFVLCLEGAINLCSSLFASA